jgi:two-component system chemotaxis sensor kinase CheA
MTKYKKLFVEEAREHLTAAGQSILALEKSPGDKALIHDLFRNAHSVKGMAASLGYEAFTRLAHSLEDLMDLSRRGEREPDSHTIDLLLRGFDHLEKMLTDIEADRPETDPSSLCAEIQALRGAPVAPPPPSPGPVESLTTVRATRTADPEAAPADGEDPSHERRLRVSFRIASECMSPGARGFLAVRALSDLGEVKQLRPDLDVIKSGKYGRVIDAEILTKTSPDDVALALAALSEIREVRVGPATGPHAAAPPSPSQPPEAASVATHPNTIRVKTEILDRFVDSVGELILNKAELREIARELGSQPLHEIVSRLETSLEELKRQAMSVRLTPLDRVFARLPRVVRDLALSRGKEVDLEVRGGTLELDRAVVDALGDPMIHLVRNAVDHGIETSEERSRTGKAPTGRILIEAYREKDVAVIHVEDNGRGVDGEEVRRAAVARGLLEAGEESSLDETGTFALLFRPGMSTAAEVSDVSGRGVGLDAVKSRVQGLGGSVTLVSTPGTGTQFTLRIPFSAAIVQALIVRLEKDLYAFPVAKIERALDVEGTDLLPGAASGGVRWFCRCDDDLLPARPLSELLGFHENGGEGITARTHGVLVAQTRAGRSAVLVDAFAGQEEVFVKPLKPPLSALDSLSGITVLGNGRPVLVLDPHALGVAPTAHVAFPDPTRSTQEGSAEERNST